MNSAGFRTRNPPTTTTTATQANVALDRMYTEECDEPNDNEDFVCTRKPPATATQFYFDKQCVQLALLGWPCVIAAALTASVVDGRSIVPGVVGSRENYKLKLSQLGGKLRK